MSQISSTTETSPGSLPGGDIWLAAGLRTPFAKVDGPLAALDAIALSVPVAEAMSAQAQNIDFAVWGSVAANLAWSNIAREVLLTAGLDPAIPAFTTIMACSTSMVGVFEAAGMLDGRGRNLALVGGVESMSGIQIGLGQNLSTRLRRIFQARSMGERLSLLGGLRPRDIRLFIPAIQNRVTGKSMGEHTEEMAKTWQIPRAEQDKVALDSHLRAVAGWESGFFDDLVIPVGEARRDTLPRGDTTMERLARLKPSFDRKSGKGTLTAGNSSPLTDGAASLFVATEKGLSRLPASLPRVKLLDWEVSAIDLRNEGLLMAPAYGIPRLLARHNLVYADIALWEIHEAFAAQVLCHLKALQDPVFLRDKAGMDRDFGAFPVDRMNPNGGSVALGHPFGATGARILSQAVKELAAMPMGAKAIVSICADGGQGTMALLERA